MTELSLGQRERVYSIDILRGITIFMMIFVNDLAGVSGTPGWLRHFPPDGDGMTIVDLVFPAFLFVMGMSIPMSIGRKLAEGVRWTAVLPHVLIRTFSLLLIGVFMVNDPGDSQMGLRSGLWSLLMYGAVFLVWSAVPSSSDRAKKITVAVRVIGAVALAFLAIMFRDPEGHWLRTQWYGILGLIGIAYLIATLIYLVFRDNRTALVGSMSLLICVYIAFREGLLNSAWVGGGMVGGHPAIAVGGVFLGTLLSGNVSGTERGRAAFGLIGFSAAAAWLLRPLYGIGKNPATPSWCLWSIALTALLWVALHIVVDIRKQEQFLRPFRLLGNNALFAYILAPFLCSAFDVAGLNYWGLGEMGFLTGLIRSVCFTVFVSTVVIWITRMGFRLKL